MTLPSTQGSTRFLTRRNLLQLASLAACAAATRGIAQNPVKTLATTPLGTLRGEAVDGVRIFRGVPFAQPPVGPLRFKPPVAVLPWAGVRDALHVAAAATQPNRGNTGEDCLYLNIFAPDGKGPFPVFFWIHGGGFTSGSPGDFDGSVFAKQGIVVVTVAYRLGAFGFLDYGPLLGPAYADSANNGLRDLVLGLQWVGANIRSFGGDASRVTIGGESAGAKLVGSLMAVDEAKPLFRSAISESGGGERIRPKSESAEVSQTFLRAFAGASDTLPAASPDTLLAAQRGLTEAWNANFPLRLESGGALLPQRAIAPIARGSARGKRLLLGTNLDESALFLGNRAAAPLSQRNLGNLRLDRFTPVLERYRALYPQMSAAQRNIRALTAEEYWLPSLRLVEAHLAGGGTAWMYRLDEKASSGPLAGTAYHSYDLGFVWSRLDAGEPPPAQHLGRQMNAAWAAFIREEVPASIDLPRWPQYTLARRETMIFDNTSRMEVDPNAAERMLWNGFAFD